VLLPRELPENFVDWNREWGAPHGHASLARLVRRRALERGGLGDTKSAMRAAGPFALQGNNDTRTVEYPWAWFSADGGVAGRDVVEVGGALSGFQFALSKSGARVVNVDPGEHDGEYWEHRLPLDQTTIARLNRTFRTDVCLQGTTLPDAQLPASSVDLVFSISTIEHVPHDDALRLAAEIGRVLRTGGRCSLTIDLFLDLAPFSDRATNRWGRNIDVREFVDASGLDLVEGDVTRLVGYDSFDANAVVANLGDYFVGSGHPTCAQALVLEKRVQ
jgi:SAM-dependent methyltransferase